MNPVVFPDDSRAGVPSAASLGRKGAPVEGPPGRPATEAAPPVGVRGPVPGCVEPGTAGLPSGSPRTHGRPAQSPEGSARSAAALPSAWQVFDDAPLPALRLRMPEPPDEAA